MIATISHKGTDYRVDFNQPIDISIPMRPAEDSVRAWYVDAPVIVPVEGDGFIGEIKQGGSVNFRNIMFNPHGHGTHTECVGHITPESESVNQQVKKFHFIAELVTIDPEPHNEDLIITKDQIEKALDGKQPEAIVIRTHPNTQKKLTKNYSNTNPPYLTEECAKYIAQTEIEHLLIDLPSVDREFDEGKLLAHRAFWNYPENTRLSASITEMIYVSEEITDGTYLLNLQFASFENDASPSKPVLFKLF